MHSRFKLKKRAILCVAAVCFASVISFSGCKGEDGAPTVSKTDDYPASSLVMTSSQADSLEKALSVKLYYQANGESLMISETALVEFDSHDKRVSKLAGEIVNKLMEGPSNASLLVSLVPKETEVKSISLKNGTLKIDVNSAFTEGISQDAELARLAVYSIVNTLTELKDVERVEFTCNGDPISPLPCGFEFRAFERDLSIVQSDETASVKDESRYDETFYENVDLE